MPSQQKFFACQRLGKFTFFRTCLRPVNLGRQFIIDPLFTQSTQWRHLALKDIRHSLNKSCQNQGNKITVFPKYNPPFFQPK